MILTPWSAALARQFWQLAGREEPFPRTLRRSLTRALPLAVLTWPQLTLAQVCAWLQGNRVACPKFGADRRLRGCLFARAGKGFIFLDGSDPDEEQRFSLAHEVAHFLRDYWQPRQQAQELLGTSIVEVLDGQRAPTTAERWHALLAHSPLGWHVHLMQREEETPTVALAERQADLLACELLAPAEIVQQRSACSQEELTSVLVREFGLPVQPARLYSQWLLPSQPADPWLARLRKIF
jgi:Zn-dependent peptidase ImmA (M78 family)